MILGIIESLGTHLKMGVRVLYIQAWLALILYFNSATRAILVYKRPEGIEECYGTPAPDLWHLKVVICQVMAIVAFMLLALTLLLEVTIHLVSLAYIKLVYD